MPFKNFSWNSKGATPLALQVSSGYEGKLYVQPPRPLSSRMLPAIVRLMVLGIKESALMCAPQKILVSEPNLGPALTTSWSSRWRYFDLSSLSHGGSASGWDQEHCSTPPMLFHPIIQPHHPYVSHSTKQLTCSCNHWHIIRVYVVYITSFKLNLEFQRWNINFYQTWCYPLIICECLWWFPVILNNHQ